MKNKKTILGSAAAITASVALIAGGTFAAWSDFAEITGNESGAGVLTLDVSARDGSPTFTIDDMVPGGSGEANIFLVNRDADAVPLADVTMKFQNVVNNENGCQSNSEAVAENGTDVATGDADCANASDTGEFGDQATAQILKSAPSTTASASDCPSTGVYGSISPSTHNRTLNQILLHQSSSGASLGAGHAYDLGDLGPGEGVCVRMSVQLPYSATDSSQGDSVSYDMRFDLTQQ